MPFNSYQFILLFLPATVGLFLLLGRFSRDWALGWLILASLLFYGLWRPADLLVLAPLLGVNFVAARLTLRRAPKAGLVCGVLVNVAVLAGFLVWTSGEGPVGILPPLGIAFITLRQIGLLADIAGGRVRGFTARDYLLHALFFPQLVAGPIPRLDEIAPQFDKATCRFDATLFALAVTLFTFGLFKKVVLADGMGAQVAPIYDTAAAGGAVTVIQGWIAALGFTLQFYFDFSGYSDMACATALFFGIRLPMNFNSPLRAGSIIGFWQGWAVTVTRFFTAHVFNPMAFGLSRMVARRGWTAVPPLVVLAAPLLATMLLAGLWNGVGVTFLLWGLLNGFYLLVNHLWRRHGPKPPLPWLGIPLTLLAVAVAMVLFRAPDLASAGHLFAGMLGMNGPGLPGGSAPMRLREGPVDALACAEAVGYLVGLLAIALMMPNSLAILSAHAPVLNGPTEPPVVALFGRTIVWQPTLVWMAITCLLAAASMILLSGQGSFLYWQS